MAPKRANLEPPPGMLPDGTLAVVNEGDPRRDPTVVQDDQRPEDFDDLEREIASEDVE